MSTVRAAMLFVCLGFWHLVLGQSVEQLRKQFPQDNAVMLNKNLRYNFSIRDGKPYVESEELQQIEFLSTQASIYMGHFGFTHSDFQQPLSYQAYTKTASDKKIMVNEFKTSSNKADFVFYDDEKETTFDFPSVGEGAVGNLQISWLNKNPYLLVPFYFKAGVPVLKSELTISFPKDMNIKYRIVGQDSANVLVSEQKRKDNTYTFRMVNCSSERAYDDAPGRAWYSTHVIFYIDSYKDEAGHWISFLSNKEDLFRLHMEFVKNINHEIGPELKRIVDSLTTNDRTEEARARHIYSWVQQQIKYVAFEEGMEGFVPRDANLVCSRRFGDCKDMSSILTTMLKAAGVPAYYTWIGTRHLPYKFSQLPLPIVSNHMICTIQLDGKYIFLDGTDPTCIFGFPSNAIQDKEAMIALDEKECRILTVPIIAKEQNELVDSTFLELTDKGLKGSIRRRLSGYFSMDMYGQMQFMNKTDLRDKMKKLFNRGSNKFQLDSFRIGSPQGRDCFLLSADFTLPDYAKKLGTDWYINLNLFKFYEHDEIDYPRRKMPIEENFRNTCKYVIVLKLPAGYKVEELPESKNYQNGVWGFSMKYSSAGESVILTQRFDNDHLMLMPQEFELWNKVLENLYPLYKQTLSITKK